MDLNMGEIYNKLIDSSIIDVLGGCVNS